MDNETIKQITHFLIKEILTENKQMKDNETNRYSFIMINVRKICIRSLLKSSISQIKWDNSN